jgi:hypothetical protein
MTAADLSEAAIWAWWCNQSAAQGLAPEIEPALIQRVAELALAGNDDMAILRHQGRKGGPAASASGVAATTKVPQQ